MAEDPDYLPPTEFQRRMETGEPAAVRGGRRPSMVREAASDAPLEIKTLLGAVVISQNAAVPSATPSPSIARSANY